MTRPCRCDHDAAVHTHLRPGTDCSQCRCDAFVPQRSPCGPLATVVTALLVSLANRLRRTR